MTTKKRKPSTYLFRLFIAGDTENSIRAIANLTALCDQHAEDNYEVEIVDVLREPMRALAENILLTPTLLKLSPVPVRSIIGTLTQSVLVAQALGMGAAA